MSQPSFPPYPDPRIARPGAGDRELRREAEAAVEARRDLGPDYDDAIAAGLADKVEQLVAYRTAELRMQSEAREAESVGERTRRNQRFVLGIVSLATGVPITAIAAVNVDPGALGVLLAWAGIVGVNVAAGWNGRRRS
ncbi:MAG TPA: hypothetical protein VFP34_20170 [Microlunatus sp.]|nr:hypothetical protein [Microlunatus sp.]